MSYHYKADRTVSEAIWLKVTDHPDMPVDHLQRAFFNLYSYCKGLEYALAQIGRISEALKENKPE